MDPITIAIGGALCASALAGGFALGRRQGQAGEAEVLAPLPPAPKPDPRHAEAEAELRAMRAMFGASGAPIAEGPLGPQLGRLQDALTRILAQKQTRACAILDAQGLALVSHGAAAEIGALGALHNASQALCGPLEGLTWRDELGNTITLRELPRARGLTLAVWSVGAALDPAALASARLALGATLRDDGPAPATRHLSAPPEAPSLLRELLAAQPLRALTLWRPEGAQHLGGEQRAGWQGVWRYASQWAATRAPLRLGQSEQLSLHHGGLVTSIHAAPPRQALLLLTHDARQHTQAHATQWLIQLERHWRPQPPPQPEPPASASPSAATAASSAPAPPAAKLKPSASRPAGATP